MAPSRDLTRAVLHLGDRTIDLGIHDFDTMPLQFKEELEVTAPAVLPEDFSFSFTMGCDQEVAEQLRASAGWESTPSHDGSPEALMLYFNHFHPHPWRNKRTAFRANQTLKKLKQGYKPPTILVDMLRLKRDMKKKGYLI